MRLLFAFLILSASALAQEVAPTPAELPVAESVLAAPSDPYTVTDVIVDVSGDDAVKAREEAFAKGPQLALQKWLAQNGSELDAAGLDADRLVDDFQVMEERFSRTRYMANLTYHLKPGAASRVLNPNLPPPVDPNAPAQQMQPIVDDPGLTAPYDPDAPWAPAQPPGTVSAPPGAPQTTGGMQTWPLTVKFGQVTQWLMAQDLLTARPEIRGVKLLSMTGDRAQLTVTTEEAAAEIRARWQSMGWTVGDDGQGGLILDAAPLGPQTP